MKTDATKIAAMLKAQAWTSRRSIPADPNPLGDTGTMTRVRFAPSPTGSLHIGNALSAVANRSFGTWMLLRIDDTDPMRNVPGGEEAILADLDWLGIAADDGPVRQSERQERYREAAARVGERFDGITLLREDGSATFHLASVVDDIDFGITHVIRGADHRSNEPLHRRLHQALDTTPPEYIHHGLVLGPDGKKLSKRAEGATVASLRDAGVPAEVGPALRGARDLREAREYARQILEPEPVRLPAEARPTLERFKELLNGDAREAVRELKAVGGDLHALRLALTGRERGPELWTIVAALSREEALRRIEAALAA